MVNSHLTIKSVMLTLNNILCMSLFSHTTDKKKEKKKKLFDVIKTKCGFLIFTQCSLIYLSAAAGKRKTARVTR